MSIRPRRVINARISGIYISPSCIIKSYKSNLSLWDLFNLDALVLKVGGQLDNTVRLLQILRRRVALMALCLRN